MKKILFRVSCILFTMLLVTQCQQPRQTADSSSDIAAKLYVDNCARCHLANGSGDQPIPGGGIPSADIRQFTKTAPELVAVINNGFGKMPALKDSISAENASLIANYVATQIERRPGAANNAPGMETSSGGSAK